MSEPVMYRCTQCSSTQDKPWRCPNCDNPEVVAVEQVVSEVQELRERGILPAAVDVRFTVPVHWWVVLVYDTSEERAYGPYSGADAERIAGVLRGAFQLEGA